MEKSITFTAALAGIPVGITCRFQRTREFLSDYITEEAPLFTVCPSDEDLERIKVLFEKEYGNTIGLTEEFLENNAVHGLIAEGLADYGVMLMHGSAIACDGCGYIFTAKSGVGKSTHAAYWKQVYGDRVTYINDDKPLLKITPDGVFVYGSPWDGKHRRSNNCSAPLRAVVSLSRGESDHIEHISAAEAFAVFYKQTLSVKDPVREAKLLALQKQVLEKVPFFALQCTNTPEAAIVSYNGIEKYIKELSGGDNLK